MDGSGGHVMMDWRECFLGLCPRLTVKKIFSLGGGGCDDNRGHRVLRTPAEIRWTKQGCWAPPQCYKKLHNEDGRHVMMDDGMYFLMCRTGRELSFKLQNFGSHSRDLRGPYGTNFGYYLMAAVGVEPWMLSTPPHAVQTSSNSDRVA